jgi:hypothetical protein
MSFQAWLLHTYTHETRQDGCAYCQVVAPAVTCTPANPITADEEPWTVVEEVRLAPRR